MCRFTELNYIIRLRLRCLKNVAPSRYRRLMHTSLWCFMLKKSQNVYSNLLYSVVVANWLCLKDQKSKAPGHCAFGLRVI